MRFWASKEQVSSALRAEDAGVSKMCGAEAKLWGGWEDLGDLGDLGNVKSESCKWTIRDKV
jgi:hypothetical protein